MKNLSNKELRQFKKFVNCLFLLKIGLVKRVSETELSILLWSIFCASKFFRKFKNFYIYEGSDEVCKKRIIECPSDALYKKRPFGLIDFILYCAQNNRIYTIISDIPSGVGVCLVKTIN